MSKPLVSEEVAVGEFVRICEFMRIMTDESRMKDDEKDDFLKIKDDITDAIMDGAITVDDDGKPTFISECDKEFSFRRLTGADFLDLDKYKSSQQMKSNLRLVANMCGVEIKNLSTLMGDDMMFLAMVAGFFMGSRKQRSSRSGRKS